MKAARRVIRPVATLLMCADAAARADVWAGDPLPWRRQRHLLGPALFGRFDGWRRDVALLAGVSDAAPRATLRGQLGYRF